MNYWEPYGNNENKKEEKMFGGKQRGTKILLNFESC
jgi:hypothetical protein